MLEKNFMQEILRRFDQIDSKLDKNSKKLDENSIKVKENSEKIEKISKTLEENSKKLDENSIKIRENSEKIKEVSKVLDKNSMNLENLSELISSHNRILVNFETKINEKISTLFDSYSYNQDKHTIYEKNLDILNQESFNHNVRISALEDLHKTKLA